VKIPFAAAIVIAVVLFLFRWWNALMVLGIMAAALPLSVWMEGRKAARELAKRGLPRRDAPGRVAVGKPVAGCDPQCVVGRRSGGSDGDPTTTGECCDHPDWIPAYRVSDDDRVPCCACGQGVMKVGQHSIH